MREFTLLSFTRELLTPGGDMLSSGVFFLNSIIKNRGFYEKQIF